MHLRTSLFAVPILAAAVLARSEAAPAGHPLPLHDGFYLNAEVPCGRAYTADMVQMMGNRFEAGRELCTIKSVSRHGTSFIATHECQDTITGAKRSGKLTMVIPDNHTVIFDPKAQPTRYRYCRIPSLPASFRHAQETVPDTPPFQQRP